MSTLDLASARAQRTVCSQCRCPVERLRHPGLVEFGLRILVAVVLSVMVTPLAVLAWRFCSDVVSDHFSHTIINHPLEDWTQY